MAKPIERNNALYDTWSLAHLASGILLGWLMHPLIGLLLLILWEPLEILVLSPLLAKFGIVFGYETLRNSLSDMVFDAVGIVIGFYLLTALISPPFRLF